MRVRLSVQDALKSIVDSEYTLYLASSSASSSYQDVTIHPFWNIVCLLYIRYDKK